MTTSILHYIFDPYCGWCYAASPLIAAAAQNPSLAMALHAGGMLSDQQRMQVSPSFRQFVLQHDERIKKMTGLPFGDAYLNGLLNDNSVVMDSTPPITGILAASSVDNKGLALLKRLQNAHYVEGRHISEYAVIEQCAVDIGLPRDLFAQAFQANSGSVCQKHIQQSRAFLQEVDGEGFPTLLLQRDQELHRVDIAPWLGNPDAFAQWINDYVPQTDAAGGEYCGLDGCYQTSGE